jgi:hypothetical protein
VLIRRCALHSAENYESLLLSGMYGITPKSGGGYINMTPETVESIDEIVVEFPQKKV